jgi:hypothetical protein
MRPAPFHDKHIVDVGRESDVWRVEKCDEFIKALGEILDIEKIWYLLAGRN